MSRLVPVVCTENDEKFSRKSDKVITIRLNFCRSRLDCGLDCGQQSIHLSLDEFLLIFYIFCVLDADTVRQGYLHIRLCIDV